MRLAGLASFAQQRMWLRAQLTPDVATNNIVISRRISGALDPARLENAIGEIVERHDVLRTGLLLQDGRLHQVIAPPVSLTLDVEAVATYAEACRRSAELSAIPFDLSVPGLFRGRLYRIAPADHVLTFIFHHAIFDGLSIRVIDSELSALYQRPGSMPPLPFQYADVSQAQHLALNRGALDADLAYWRKQLDPWPPAFQLPADRPRRPGEVSDEKEVSAELPEPLLADITKFAQEHGATVFNVLLAALAALIYRYTGVSDITIATPVAGRQSEELMPLIGMFSNTILLRIDVSDRPTFAQLVARVRDVTLDGLEHQRLPFEKAVEATLPRHGSRPQPPFSVLVEYHHLVSDERVLTDDHIVLTPVEVPTSEKVLLDLMVSIEVSDRRCELVAHFAVDLFDSSSIDLLLQMWETILRHAMRHPGDRVAGPREITSAVPRTGQLDRERPPGPDCSGPAADRAAASATEQLVCGLLTEVLGVLVEDPDADFFEMGGHSVLAMRLAGSVRARTGVNLPITAIFKQPTAAKLAAYIDQAATARR